MDALARIVSRFRRRKAPARLSSAPYISGDTIKEFCDFAVGESVDGPFVPQSLQAGCSIFCKADYLVNFFEREARLIQQPYVLVSGNSDENISPDFARFLDGRIVAWYAQNLVKDFSEKVKPLPIGLENLHYQNHGLVADFAKLRLKPVAKQARILYGFNVGTNPLERTVAMDVLKRCEMADKLEPVPSRRYREVLHGYGFVASPPGNGLDCHRTWEALYLRSIPIVKESFMSAWFRDAGLPLLVVGDWNEILEWDTEFLERKYRTMADGFESPLLWADYWKSVLSAEQ